jgi:hypothetical protein
MCSLSRIRQGGPGPRRRRAGHVMQSCSHAMCRQAAYERVWGPSLGRTALCCAACASHGEAPAALRWTWASRTRAHRPPPAGRPTSNCHTRPVSQHHHAAPTALDHTQQTAGHPNPGRCTAPRHVTPVHVAADTAHPATVFPPPALAGARHARRQLPLACWSAASDRMVFVRAMHERGA